MDMLGLECYFVGPMDEIIAYCLSHVYNRTHQIIRLLFSVSLSEFIHNPLAELFPLLVPVLNVLCLDAVPILTTVNVANPLFIGLVLEVRPPKAVLGQGTLFLVVSSAAHCVEDAGNLPIRPGQGSQRPG